MSIFQISREQEQGNTSIHLPTSKSIANRLLVLQALSNYSFSIKDLSEAKDTEILLAALKAPGTNINVGMAGTAFRFLTAYFALGNKEVLLSGAERMKERPIHVLVDQLRALGANIDYEEKSGFPPLKIMGRPLKGGDIKVDGSISSQFITALLLIAPFLEGGLRVDLLPPVVSLPYIDLTIGLLNQLNVAVKREAYKVNVPEGGISFNGEITVEADWSSAAFFYQVVALGKQKISIKGLHEDSLQGDRRCAELFEQLGVQTVFTDSGVQLEKKGEVSDELFFEMGDCPDLIPSVAVTASHLANKVRIHGVATLRIKECDRVWALKNELSKVGVNLEEHGTEVIELSRSVTSTSAKPVFSVYNDHRMAMCLAPLAFLYSSVQVQDPEVVEKSFPSFWRELKKTGLKVLEI
jgi:3-phosphoshikimate 1-carboxyvinyltransferase